VADSFHKKPHIHFLWNLPNPDIPFILVFDSVSLGIPFILFVVEKAQKLRLQACQTNPRSHPAIGK
jgi:hypothetical protein